MIESLETYSIAGSCVGEIDMTVTQIATRAKLCSAVRAPIATMCDRRQCRTKVACVNGGG